MYYLVSEYKYIQGYLYINSPVLIQSLEKVSQYINNKFNFSKVYVTHEKDSYEYFFKSVSDNSKLYYVLEIKQK